MVVVVVIVVVFVQKVRSKTFFVKKNLGQDIFNPKKFRSKNILGPKNFGLKECGRKHSRYKKFIKKVKILGRKFLVIKTFRSKKLCPKIYLTTKIKTPNQNKCHHDRWHLLKTVPGTYLLTVEIFLIWTIVARTNVAWTSVTMTIGFFSRCSQEPTFKVS